MKPVITFSKMYLGAIHHMDFYISSLLAIKWDAGFKIPMELYQNERKKYVWIVSY